MATGKPLNKRFNDKNNGCDGVLIILGTFLYHSPQNNNVKQPNSSLSGECESQQIIFKFIIQVLHCVP